jgi:DMSO/TMAO reductase YedYZ molybdopterin-dependent catalytic subunit
MVVLNNLDRYQLALDAMFGCSDLFWTGATANSAVQHTRGLLSCCEWTGVRLSTVLAEAGLKPGTAWMLAEGADSSAPQD